MSDGSIVDTISGTDKELFYSMFKGHKNVFYLYGHLHGEGYCYEDYSSGAVLHINDDNLPINDNRNEIDNLGKEYSYTLVHMGGLRPSDSKYFLNDGISGYGGEAEEHFYTKTGTPTLAQYLIFEVYENRVVFHIRNTGSIENYTVEDIPEPYTVYFQK